MTGSDSLILKEAAASFPGRRGRAERTDFHLFPLSFREYTALTHPECVPAPESRMDELFGAFSEYLTCGGYLRAINDLHGGGKVAPATYATFEQWIRGDCLKRGKSEENLLSVLQAFAETGVSQISYSSLSRRSDLLSKETFLDYARLLARMDVLFDLQAFDSGRKRGFPKKARKFHFADPFIQATIERWLMRERRITVPAAEPFRVEAAVAANYHRAVPAYYMKAAGEIDLVLLCGRHFIPVEVKWSGRIRPADLAQLNKYRNSVILTRNPEAIRIGEVHSRPLPLFLMRYYSEETLAPLCP